MEIFVVTAAVTVGVAVLPWSDRALRESQASLWTLWALCKGVFKR